VVIGMVLFMLLTGLYAPSARTRLAASALARPQPSDFATLAYLPAVAPSPRWPICDVATNNTLIESHLAPQQMINTYIDYLVAQGWGKSGAAGHEYTMTFERGLHEKVMVSIDSGIIEHLWPLSEKLHLSTQGSTPMIIQQTFVYPSLMFCGLSINS
jgi:hypothetical protein